MFVISYKINICVMRFLVHFLKSNTVISLIGNVNRLIQENDGCKIIMIKIE